MDILCWNLQARLSLVTVPDSVTDLAFEHGDFAAIWFQPDDKKKIFCNSIVLTAGGCKVYVWETLICL